MEGVRARALVPLRTSRRCARGHLVSVSLARRLSVSLQLPLQLLVSTVMSCKINEFFPEFKLTLKISRGSSEKTNLILLRIQSSAIDQLIVPKWRLTLNCFKVVIQLPHV